jgi:murein DD-endopeptidase MepM/ murein hydrolase activator NlpD
MPGRCAPVAAAVILLLPLPALLPPPLAAAAEDARAVAPGTVVRWPGEGIESCVQEERSFAPLAGACWYPVDLLAAEGAVLRLARRSRGKVEERRVRVAAYPYPVQEIEIADDSQVNLSPRDLARTERERARVAAALRREGARRFDLPLAAPLDPLPPASGFGARRVFNRQPRSPHTGADFSARRGTPVLAAAGGRVALAEEHFFAGRSVYLDHGDGLVTMYFHLEAIAVAAGEEVRRGQAIGRVGSSGRSAGPHLHFGVRWRGARVDPAVLLSPDAPPAP